VTFEIVYKNSASTINFNLKLHFQWLLLRIFPTILTLAKSLLKFE